MSLPFSIQKVNYKDRDLICGICRKSPNINSPKEWVAHPEGGEKHPLHLKCAKDSLMHGNLCPSGCGKKIDRSSLLSLKERVNVQAHELRPWVKVAIQVVGLLSPGLLSWAAWAIEMGPLVQLEAMAIPSFQLFFLGLRMHAAKADPSNAPKEVFCKSWYSLFKNAALISGSSALLNILNGIPSGQVIKEAAFIGISQFVLLATFEKMYETALEVLQDQEF